MKKKKKLRGRYAFSELQAVARERPVKTKGADEATREHRKLMRLLRQGKNQDGPDGVGQNFAAAAVSSEAALLATLTAPVPPEVRQTSVIPVQSLEDFARGAQHYFNSLRDAHEAQLAADRAAGRPERRNSMGSYWSGAYGLPGGAQQTNLTSFEPMGANLQFAPLTLQWLTLMYAYTTYGIIQRAVDVPVYDAYRGGLELESNEITDYRDLDSIGEALEENGIIETYRDARIWSRLFGGGAVIANTNGEDFSAPLRLDKLRGRLELYDACRWELGSESRIPQSGYYDFYGLKVHASRVMTMCGKRAPFLIRDQLAGWGLSEIQRMSEDFNGYIRTKNAAFELMLEAKIDVFKVKGYNSQLNSPMASQLTNRRVGQINSLKSFSNALLLDKEDDYQQKQVTFAGIAEMKKENRMDIAESMQMPMSKIWGIASSGFSSGEDDLESYNATVESNVREPDRPRLRRVLKMLVRSMFGADLHINFKFKPLRVLSSLDEESIKTSKHARILSCLQSGLISRQDALEWEKRENLIPIGIENRAEFEDLPGAPMSPDAQAADELLPKQAEISTSGQDRGELKDRQMETTANGTPDGPAVGYPEIGTEPPPVGFPGGGKAGIRNSRPGISSGEEGISGASPWPGPSIQTKGATMVKGPGKTPKEPERVEKAGQ